MSDLLNKNTDYADFIRDIKNKVHSAQIKASVSVNRRLLQLYWEIAELIVEKQKSATWGDGFISQMAKDLQAEFQDMKGFSKRNLELMRQWYLFWQSESPIARQLATQIPWWHNVLIISKIKNHKEALFYGQNRDSDYFFADGCMAKLINSRCPYYVCLLCPNVEQVTTRNKKTRQLLIYTETVCVCRFIQTV